MPRKSTTKTTKDRGRKVVSRPVVPKKINEDREEILRTLLEKAPKATDITPRFKLIFIVLIIGTFISGAVYLYLCIKYPVTDLTSRIQDAVETMKTVFCAGFGTMIGLIGGKIL